MREYVFDKWFKGEYDIACPERGCSGAFRRRYEFASYLDKMLAGELNVCPEFYRIRELIRDAIRLNVIGIMVEAHHYGHKAPVFLYDLTLYYTGPARQMLSESELKDLEGVKEYIAEITEYSPIRKIRIGCARSMLAFKYQVDAIAEVRGLTSDRCDDIEFEHGRFISVIYEMDKDLLRNRDNGVSDGIAELIWESFLKKERFDCGVTELSVNFKSIENRIEPVQNPISDKTVLIPVSSVHRDITGRKSREPLRITTFRDARGHVFIDVEWREEYERERYVMAYSYGNTTYSFSPDTVVTPENCLDLIASTYPIGTFGEVSYPDHRMVRGGKRN